MGISTTVLGEELRPLLLRHEALLTEEPGGQQTTCPGIGHGGPEQG